MNTQIVDSPEELICSAIHDAMNKVNAEKETDLCRYIPGNKGPMHHWTFKRLKRQSPIELFKMIQGHILENKSPEPMPPKTRPRVASMNKRTIELVFKRSQFSRLANILKTSGDEELIAMLSPYQTLGQVQKAMQNMIRSKEVDQDLWEAYVKLAETENARKK
jgi:hypothetical protein